MKPRRRKPRHRKPAMPDPRLPLRLACRSLGWLTVVAGLGWLLWPPTPAERIEAAGRTVAGLERQAGGPGR